MSVTTDTPIEIREMGGKFYASSPKQGWYLVDLGDAHFPASCECADHKYRGRECKHIARVRALLEARARTCPCCGQAVPEPVSKREPILTDAEMQELWR